MAGPIETKLDAIDTALSNASKAVDALNKSALAGSDGGVNDLLNVMRSSIGVADELSATILSLGAAIPVVGGLVKPFEVAQEAITSAAKAGVTILSIFNDLGEGLDSLTSFSRNLDSSMYDLSSNFAGSFSEAKKFGEYIINSSEEFAKAESGFISTGERIGAAKALAEAGVPIQRMGESIQFAGGEMDILNVSILQAKALGMSVEGYSQKISDAMLNQGLSTQQAVEQMTMFGEISKEIGLPVDSIAGNLSSLADKFSLLGVKADFGRPILEGFSKSLKGLGLGTKNALELTSTFSDALVRLTSDYAAAYLTFQRGGLDIGTGGGVLGASIGLRSKMLEAQKPGGDQGQLAMELADSMKETLKSFAGGQVVTVTEAAKNPELQQAFYTQTQLLKDLYGIQDTGAQDRTLELLQQLETATSSGDTDLQASLAKQLEEAKTGRVETIDYQRAAAVGIEATVAQLSLAHSDDIIAAKENAKLLAYIAAGVNEKFMGSAAEASSMAMNSMSGAIGDPAALKQQVSSYMESKTTEGVMSDVKETASTAVRGVADKAVDVKDNGVAELTRAVGMLVDKISLLLNNRTSSSVTG